MAANNEQTGTVSKAQIKAWKNKYGEIFQFTVKKEGKDINGYFKAPNANTIMAMSEFAESDKAKAMQILFVNTRIHVDPEVETDDAVRLAMIAEVRKLWKNYSVAVKKL